MQLILVLYAFGGCDTTCAIFRKSKVFVAEISAKSEHLISYFQTFYSDIIDVECIKGAGIKLIKESTTRSTLKEVGKD